MKEEGKFDGSSLETQIVHKGYCWLCGKEEEVYLETPEDAAKFLYRYGWRHAISKHYATQGTCCPECLEKDNDLELIDDHN